MLSQGEIVLIPVPFTDLKSSKRRPVIVVSNDHYNTTFADMVVVAMTSNSAMSAFALTIETADLASGVLNRPSTVRTDKTFTLSQLLAIKAFGKVREHVLEQVRQKWTALTATS